MSLLTELEIASGCTIAPIYGVMFKTNGAERNKQDRKQMFVIFDIFFALEA